MNLPCHTYLLASILYLSRISAPTAAAAVIVAADSVYKPQSQDHHFHEKKYKTHETKKIPPPASSGKPPGPPNPSLAADHQPPPRLPPKPKGSRSKRTKPLPPTPAIAIPSRTASDAQRETIDRRRAVLRALEVIASSSKVFEPKHGAAAAARKGMGVQMG
jgi:hypothetical protein